MNSGFVLKKSSRKIIRWILQRAWKCLIHFASGVKEKGQFCFWTRKCKEKENAFKYKNGFKRTKMQEERKENKMSTLISYTFGWKLPPFSLFLSSILMRYQFIYHFSHLFRRSSNQYEKWSMYHLLFSLRMKIIFYFLFIRFPGQRFAFKLAFFFANHIFTIPIYYRVSRSKYNFVLEC